MLKHPADRRTVAYMVVATGLLVAQWSSASFHPALFVWACFMGVTASVMAHNHGHIPMWRAGWMNALQDYWITLFYGFPVFAWIPTHNRNHHRFTNKPGDRTATWKHSAGNNLATLLTYPSRSGAWQQPVLRDYLAQQWRNNRRRFWYCVSQIVVLVAFVGTALWIDWQKALLYIVVPQQVGMFTVLVFNYVQHVHTDEAHPWNHSRNIVGPGLNVLLFNNGFHTVHHNKPSLHWSELPAAHAEVAHLIDPRLNEPTFWGYILRTYVLGLVSAKYRTTDMGAANPREEAAA